MCKRFNFSLAGIICIAFVLSCGGQTTIERVCGAGAAKMYIECDIHDANDVISILEAFDTLGIPMTESGLLNLNEEQAKSACAEALKGETISKEYAQLFEDGLSELTPGCDEAMGYFANLK